MKLLNIEELKIADSNFTINQVSFLLDRIKKNEIDQIPWKGHPYAPVAQWAMAYSNDCIFLKYYVTEKSIRAVNNTINSAVWEDSCVEFFISFDEEETYYNLEFNCIGTARVGYGVAKNDRELLPVQLISQIKYMSVISNPLPSGNIHWELTLSIPNNLFCFNKVEALKGKKCRANFYKCGDNLSTPHFISWSGIKSATPDFHLPQFFGALHFI